MIYIFIFCSTESEPMEDIDEQYSKMKLSFGCPKYLVQILKYQSRLSEPYLHVKYMKFRIKYPTGFIGKQALMVSEFSQPNQKNTIEIFVGY